LPVRIVPGIAFIAMICGFVYVLRHLRKIEKAVVADNLGRVSSERAITWC
jgi:hypothetical protein